MRRFGPWFAVALLVCALAGPVRAEAQEGNAGAPQVPPAGALAVNGEIDALDRVGDRLLLRGDFSRIGPYTGSALGLDPMSGARDQAFALINGQVSDVVSDGAGGWYLGGSFTSAGRLPHRNLAHVRADGTVDPAFTATTDGFVDALAFDGARLFVGGSFGAVDGQRRIGLAAVDARSGAVLSWDARQTVPTTELAYTAATAALPARLYAGARQVLCLDPQSAAPCPGFSSDLDADVRAIAATSDRVYVGGDGLVALDARTGERDATFRPTPRTLQDDPSFKGTVHVLSLDAGRLLAGGDFAALGGAAGPLVALDPVTGRADRTFLPQITDLPTRPDSVSGDVADDTSDEDATIGDLRSASARGHRRKSRATDDSDSAGDRGVFDLARIGDRLWIGGRFGSVAGHPVTNLAVIDAATGALAGITPPYLDEQVNALEPGASRLFVGGQFALAGSVAARSVAAVDAASLRLDPGFTASLPSEETITPAGPRFVLGPTRFSGYANVHRRRGARRAPRRYGSFVSTLRVRVTATGATAAAWPRGLRVRDLAGVAVRGDQLFVVRRGGDDRHRFPPNGVTVYDLATARPVRRFALPYPGYVTGLVFAGDDLYAAGSFRRRRLNGQQANLALMHVSPRDGHLIEPFDTHANGPIYDLAALGRRVAISGLFRRAGYPDRRVRHGLAVVQPRSGALLDSFASRRLEAFIDTQLQALPGGLLADPVQRNRPHADPVFQARLLDPVTELDRAPVAGDYRLVIGSAAAGGRGIVVAADANFPIGSQDSAGLSFLASVRAP